MEHEYACADCGHEQDSMTKPCEKCGGIRVVLITVLKQIAGTDWRATFDEVDGNGK